MPDPAQQTVYVYALPVALNHSVTGLGFAEWPQQAVIVGIADGFAEEAVDLRFRRFAPHQHLLRNLASAD